MPLAFSTDWARAWCAALNASDAYRTVAATWEGSVALVAQTDGMPVAAVFLDLWHGECREAREATGADVASATFLLEAEVATWRALLDRGLSPVAALLSGQLSLVRGLMASLLPHAGAARELLRLAEAIETEFPPGW